MSNVNIIVEEQESDDERKVGIRNNGAFVLDETNASRVVVEPESDASSVCSGPEDDAAVCSATNTALSGVLNSRVLDVKALPPVGEINVQNSNDVHFGHKIYAAPVTVVQATDDMNGMTLGERIKYRIKNASRLEKIIFVVVGLVILLAISLTVFFTTFDNAVVQVDDRSLASWYVPRDDWLAVPWTDREDNAKNRPLKMVVVGHTVSGPCYTFNDCSASVHYLQSFFMHDRNFTDIAYNFVVGGDGRVYEGRGWFNQGAHTVGSNMHSIGVGFIGDYRTKVIPGNAWLTIDQEEAFKKLMEMGLHNNYLDANYLLVGQCDVSGTESPGDLLYKYLIHWDHYDREKYGKCKFVM